MLLKYPTYQKRSKLTGSGKAQRSTGNVKVLLGKGNRKGLKGGLASKRIKTLASKREEVPVLQVDASDSSNDSGLGFDHHLEFQIPKTTQTSYLEPDFCWPEADEAKKQRLDIKLESDNANDDFTFPQTRLVNPTSAVADCSARGKVVPTGKNLKRSNQANANQSVGVSRDGKVQLVILSQPETQHRARYQTEGSRGAVKDRTGNGFPIVKLNGYNKPAILEVYIGTDQGRVAPHMFYQACRVSGKNSTPCVEKKVDGTVLIEIELDPLKEMIATCDCVGILKERNVDVEHRFPEESSGRSKKKSTRCRMVFKTVITNNDDSQETIQVTSQPIICTQPPGIPEISKKSLSSCPVTGGLELFILGKNFLKDTKVVFTEGEAGSDDHWQSVVQPDKEFLQQSHLVCVIPPYKLPEVKEPVAVKLIVLSSGRNSEPHTFIYSPVGTPPLQALVQEPNVNARAITQSLSPATSYNGQSLLVGVPLIPMGSNNLPTPPSHFISEDNFKLQAKEDLSAVHSVMLMPPPTLLPPSVRRSSQPPPSLLIPDGVERDDESPAIASSGSDLSTSQTPSLSTIERFVSSSKLPSLSVENYLSKIENKPLVTSDVTSSLLNPTSSLVSSEERIIQDQLAASMAKEAEATTKLDEFVNSTVEAHLSPNRDLKPKPELIMRDVTDPLHTSPLNCSFENIHIPTSHMNDQQLLTSSQDAMCNLLADQTVRSVTAPVLNEPSAVLLSGTFSPGKEIHAVTMSSRYEDMSVSTCSTTSPVSSSDIIMKSVVNNLNQTPSTFCTSPEVLIQSSIASPMTSSTSPISHPMMMTSQFSNPGSSEPMSIVSTDFVASEPMAIDQKCVGSNTTTYDQPMFVEQNSEANQTIVSHFTSQQDISAGGRLPPSVKTPCLNAPFSQTLVYSSPDMPSSSDKISMSQNSFEVIPTATISSSAYPEPREPVSDSRYSVNTFPTAEESAGPLSDTAPVTLPSIKTEPSDASSSDHGTSVVVTTVVGGAEGKSVSTSKISTSQPQMVRKCEEGIPLHELAQMSEQDLLIYINPSCFDQV